MKKCKMNLKTLIILGIILGLALPLISASAYNWDFSSSSDYVYNTTEIFVLNQTTQVNFTLSPSAWWHLNEGVGNLLYGSSGNNITCNNTGTTNLTWTTGKLDGGLLFTGSTTQNIDCGNNLNFDRNQTASYEFWFNTTSTSSLIMVMSKYDAGTGRGLMIYLNTGKITFDYRGSSSGYISVVTNDTFNNGVFHHAIITYDGSSLASGVKIYVDGIDKPLTTLKDNMVLSPITSANFLIAKRSAGNYWIGKLDEIVVYNVTLSQIQVNERYNGGAGTENQTIIPLVASGYAQLNGTALSPYALWHLNEASGTNVYDSSLNNRNGTIVNFPIWIAGKLNNALQFDGINQSVNFGNIANFERTEKFSVEFWIKTNSATTSQIIGRRKSVLNYNGWAVQLNSSGKIAVYLTKNDGVNEIVVRSTNSINDNTWKHIAITYNGSSTASGVKIYINGVKETNVVVLDALSDSMLTPVGIAFSVASRDLANLFFNGSVDEVTIYQVELTQAQIDVRYNGGAGRESVPNYLLGYYLIQPKTNFSYNGSLYFNETAIKVGDDLRYSLTNNGTWRYWNGVSWVASNGNWTQSNTADELNTHLGSFGNIGNFVFRAILHSASGTYTPFLDNIGVTEYSCSPVFACSLYNATCSGNPPTDYKCLQVNDTTTCCALTGNCNYAGDISDFDIHYSVDMFANSSLILPSYPYVDVNVSYTIKSSVPTNNASDVKLYILDNGTWNSYNLTYSGGYYQITLIFTEVGDFPFIINGSNPCLTLTGQVQGVFLVRSPYNVTFCGFEEKDLTPYVNDFAYLIAEFTSSKRYYDTNLEQFITPLGFATTYKTPVFHTYYRNGCGTLKLYEDEEYAVRLFDGVATYQTTFSAPNISKTYGTNIYLGKYRLNSISEDMNILLSSKDIHQYRWLANWLFIIGVAFCIIVSVGLFFVIPQMPSLSIIFGLGFIAMITLARIILFFWLGWGLLPLIPYL